MIQTPVHIHSFNKDALSKSHWVLGVHETIVAKQNTK